MHQLRLALAALVALFAIQVAAAAADEPHGAPSSAALNEPQRDHEPAQTNRGHTSDTEADHDDDELGLENELDDDYNNQPDGAVDGAVDGYVYRIPDKGRIRAHQAGDARFAWGKKDALKGESLDIFHKNSHNCNRKMTTRKTCTDCCVKAGLSPVFKGVSCTCQIKFTHLPVASSRQLRRAREEENQAARLEAEEGAAADVVAEPSSDQNQANESPRANSS